MYTLVLRDQIARNATHARMLSDTLMWFFWGKWLTTDESQSPVVRDSIVSPTGC